MIVSWCSYVLVLTMPSVIGIHNTKFLSHIFLDSNLEVMSNIGDIHSYST